MDLRPRVLFSFSVAVATVISTGCASVMRSSKPDVAIVTSPPSAQVAVHNEEGMVVATGVTPAKISLSDRKRFLRKPEKYTATIHKPGYETATVPLEPKINPWVAGNALFGGLGLFGLAADAMSGDIWRFSPNDIQRELSPIQEYYGEAAASDAEVVQASHIATDE
ncbi:MAG: hypothetical protein AAGA92_02980 [Planctomycetota bacterium]